MWTRLRRVTARTAGTDVLSLADAKEHLHVDSVDTEQDTEITAAIKAAVDRIEGPEGIGVALNSTAWRLSLDGFPACIRIPLGPVTAVSSIVYTDAAGDDQTLASTAYKYDLDADPMTIVRAPGATWPATQAIPGAVKITFTAGYADAASIPGELLRFVRLMVGHSYENREAATVGAEAFEIPMGAQMILDDFRRGVVA